MSRSDLVHGQMTDLSAHRRLCQALNNRGRSPRLVISPATSMS